MTRRLTPGAEKLNGDDGEISTNGRSEDRSKYLSLKTIRQWMTR